MNGYDRYAIYWTPEAGAFADAASSWLGWDAVAGRDVPHPTLAGLARPVSEITAAPRRYGFHATIKPPFHLAAGASADGLHLALLSLCSRLAPVAPGDLALKRIGGFVALAPRGDGRSLGALATSVVQELDGFRAPPTDAEVARRRPDKLTTRQKDNLLRWGYPYVMEDFQFHLTLSGDLSEIEADQVARALEPYLDPVLPRPFRIDDLCLFGQASHDGRFRMLHRYRLAG